MKYKNKHLNIYKNHPYFIKKGNVGGIYYINEISDSFKKDDFFIEERIEEIALISLTSTLEKIEMNTKYLLLDNFLDKINTIKETNSFTNVIFSYGLISYLDDYFHNGEIINDDDLSTNNLIKIKNILQNHENFYDSTCELNKFKIIFVNDIITNYKFNIHDSNDGINVNMENRFMFDSFCIKVIERSDSEYGIYLKQKRKDILNELY